MSVLLTGGAGYIGSHTCVKLLESGQDIVVVDNFVNSKPEALKRVREITGRDFREYRADARDGGAMDEIFGREDIDSVIHFAGLKAVGESVQHPLSYYRVNIDTTLTLLEIMAKHGVKKFVFSSSATVYGRVDVSPIPEDAELGCSSPYGWTKLMNEQILRDAAAADPAMSVAILRYFNPVGAHSTGMIGEDPSGIPTNLMPLAMNAAYSGEQLTVYGDDYPTADGTCVRDYIHVMDLAAGHESALQYIGGRPGAHIFNLGTGIGYSVFDIIGAVEAACGRKVKYVVGARRPGDVASYYADAGRASRELGWAARSGIDEMCRDAWKFKAANPEGY